jgi:hypothetical protein
MIFTRVNEAGDRIQTIRVLNQLANPSIILTSR